MRFKKRIQDLSKSEFFGEPKQRLELTVTLRALSHPFVERLIGTIRREYFDPTYSGPRPILRRNYSISSVTITCP